MVCTSYTITTLPSLDLVVLVQFHDDNVVHMFGLHLSSNCAFDYLGPCMRLLLLAVPYPLLKPCLGLIDPFDNLVIVPPRLPRFVR